MTKNWMAITLLLFLSLPSFAKIHYLNKNNKIHPDIQIANTSDQIVVNITINALETKTTVNQNIKWTEVSIPGEGHLTKPGLPQLPIIRTMIRIPHEGIKLEESKYNKLFTSFQEMKLEGQLMPAQLSHYKSDPTPPIFQYNKSTYLSPPKKEDFIILKEVLSIRGEKFQMIEIRPLYYNPTNNEIQLKNDIQLTFSLQGALHPKQKESQQKGMMILYGDTFKDSSVLEEFITFKKQAGLFIQAINVTSTGRSPVDIRNYLVKEFSRWRSPSLDYLLIIGDVEHVPAYEGNAEKSQFTDNYYACIDTASYSQDITAPDIHVGRISAKNIPELETILQRTMKYEKGLFNDYSWLRRFQFIATTDFYWNKVAEGTHDYIIQTYTKSRNYSGIFPNNPNQGGDQLYGVKFKASDNDVHQSLYDGRFIVNYSGHGQTTYWAGPYIREEHLDAYNHPDAIPYAVAHACLTNSFAMTDSDSAGEMWLKKVAIGYLGASNVTIWKEDDVHEKYMWMKMFAEGINRIGDINSHGKLGVRKSFSSTRAAYYYEIFNTLGDPSVSLYTEVPTPMTLTAEPVLIGASSFTVVVKNNKGPLANASVYFKNINGDYTAFTDAKGKATLTINTNGMPHGHHDIHVHAQNHQHSILQIPFVHSKKPYFIVETYETNSPQGPAQALFPFNLKVKIKNIGDEAGKADVKLTDLAPHMQNLNESNMLCENLTLQKGQSSWCSLSIPLSYQIPVMDKSIIQNTITAHFKNMAYQNTALLPITLQAPYFEILETKLTEIEGNSNGIPEAGESILLSYKIKNSGSVESQTTVSTPYTLMSNFSNECFEETHKDAILNPMKPKEEQTVKHIVKIKDTCPNGFKAWTHDQIFQQGHEKISFARSSHSFLVGSISEKIFNQESNLQIPDNKPEGVTAIIEINDDVKVMGLQVYVDINHGMPFDLVLTLIAPDGTKAILHERTGFSSDIRGWYGADLRSKESLDIFNKIEGKGMWQLHLADHSSNYMGTLKNLKLKINGYFRE